MANTTESSIIISKDCAEFVYKSVAAYFTVENSEGDVKSALQMALDPTGEMAFSFEHYTAVSSAWKEAYKVKRGGASMEAMNTAWSRAFEITGYKKPKAGSKAATQKAEQRSEASKAIEAEINAAGGDAVKLADAAAKATKAGDASKAKVLVSALEKIQKETASKAKKAATEAHKAKLEKIRELIKTADDAALDKLIGVLTGELVVQKKRTK